MAVLVANTAFDMRDLLTNGSLSEFFEWGTVTTATSTEFVVTYSDSTISEELTLGGTFGDYVDGYPTTGTITSASYWLNGSTLFTITGMSMSVEAFTDYVMANNLTGLFEDILLGNDEVNGSDGNDVLFGFSGNDIVRGGLGSDELYGGDGNDLLSENSGVGPYSDDFYDGGAGIDRVSYYGNALSPITLDLRIETAQNTGTRGTDTVVGIEYVTADYGDDTLIGNEAANWFWTFSGTDTLTGNGGNDYFTVGLGTKVVDGGTGIDTLEIVDYAYEPAYSIAGITISLALEGTAQTTGVGTWTITGVENLGGWYGNDRLTGNDTANVLAGGEGDDRLTGNGATTFSSVTVRSTSTSTLRALSSWSRIRRGLAATTSSTAASPTTRSSETAVTTLSTAEVAATCSTAALASTRCTAGSATTPTSSRTRPIMRTS